MNALKLAFALTLMFLCSVTQIFPRSTQDSVSVPTFASTYAQWKDPSSNFVSYISAYDQARVIFIGSEAYSQNGDGQVPTVSEGMGYGLLLAYANNDQTLFDQFLRYILATANNYGCGLYDAQTQTCLATSPFLMPWQVNELGQPFWYKPSADGEATFTSGSATDADLQIAWAVYLAAQEVSKGSWQSSTFQTIAGTLTYAAVFAEMGKAIRLADVDLDKLRYTPGNQWGSAGTEVLYPGYFTPQAFDALKTLPPLDVSHCCPTHVSAQGPASSLTLTYKNNLTGAVSIDYMGTAGTISAGSNFVPKPGNSTGYTVAPVTTAQAVTNTSNQYYNNLTFQATFYSETGTPTYWANYYFEYNTVDGVLQWRLTDKGSSPEAKVCLVDNVAHVYLTQPDIDKVNFDWDAVKINSLLAIQAFQEGYNRGIFPNTIFYDGDYPDNSFNREFAYDAIRFPLWAAPYAYMTAVDDSTSSLQRWMLYFLLNDKGVLPFIQDGSSGNTMPNSGILVFTDEAVGGYASAPPALNGPLALAAYLGDYVDLYNALIGPVSSYQIVNNQPSQSDPVGDSGPYFNAAMLLLTDMFFEQVQ